MKTEKTPDSSIMQEFMDQIETECIIKGIQTGVIGEAEAARIKAEAHADWIEHYNHADLNPTQARELAEIYIKLFFAQEEYLRLNKEWIKYK